MSVLAGGRCPPDHPNFGWGGKAPPDPPRNGRSSNLIEAAKRGRLDQMIFFFGAADDTRAADDRRPNARPNTRPKPTGMRRRRSQELINIGTYSELSEY